MKIKEVHVVNISPIIEAVLNFVKPFLKEKMRKRVSFTSLYTYKNVHRRMDGAITI